jgi:hypothetical protein
MSIESKSINCTNYDDCPKGDSVTLDPIKKYNENKLNVVMVGCWGVYGWDGEKKVTEYSLEKFLEEIGLKPDENKYLYTFMKHNIDLEGYDKLADLNGKVASHVGSNWSLLRHELLKKDNAEIYGQTSVIEGIGQYSNKNSTDALFLAGDNVYSNENPKEELINIIDVAIQEQSIAKLPTKKAYKSNSHYSGQDIETQLSEGFKKCIGYVYPNTQIFLGIGNHDIQTCEDLNKQINYKNEILDDSDLNKKYNLPGTYYNVVYEMKDYNVNFIIIDTNMFSEDFHCNGQPYTKEQKESQIQWVISALKTNACKFNIIIGHCPYMANPHKIKKKDKKKEGVKEKPVTVEPIHNEELQKLFDNIQRDGECPKVQIYMCADEHNQQFLYDNIHKMALVVAGCGGTALDLTIHFAEDDQRITTKHHSAEFGFVSFDFTENNITLTYHDSFVRGKKDIPTFSAIIDSEGKPTYLSDISKLPDTKPT